jgi:RimJ/RimL family protein N-acetyltransferase
MNTSLAEFSFRPMVHADIPMFCEWISRPHVAEWWSDAPSVDEINEWCSPAANNRRQDLHHIAILGGRDPVGFIQTYVPCECHQDGWWLDENDPGLRGIDQFLANAEQLGRGLGTRLIRAFVHRLFEDPSITRIQSDPAPANRRAIRCYEKAGFSAIREILTPDGAALLMYCDRPR